MMRCPQKLEVYRRPSHGFLGDATRGMLVIPSRQLLIIFSNGEGWEHVSVSHFDRCPAWDEMEWVKRHFWDDGDTVMQLHVPIAEHRSFHPYVLHMWRPLFAEIPRPPADMVAPANASMIAIRGSA
jgi:hypothetical protein